MSLPGLYWSPLNLLAGRSRILDSTRCIYVFVDAAVLYKLMLDEMPHVHMCTIISQIYIKRMRVSSHVSAVSA
jgi:hypothetical protein